MSSLMCFRPSKKTKKNASNRDSSYGTIDRNVAPNSRMTGGPKDVGLTVHYITSKLIVLSCDDATTEEEYRKSLQTSFLIMKTKHDKHFKVWSVSQARHDVSALCSPHFELLGWPKSLSPPLDRLCVICKQIEHWLAASTDNVAIIHCKGDPARAAMIISSYMHYNAICSNDDVVEDRFSMQRFCDKYIGGTGQPSHRRYIHYFSSLLSGRIRVNTAPLYLLGISLSNFQGVTVMLKIYERMQCVLQTVPITLKENSKIDIDEELKLRGDVLIKCIGSDDPSRAIFLCQLNTCSVDISERSKTLTFHKEDLDFIFADPSIDNKLLLELFVSFDPPKTSGGSKRTSLLENRTNSYENFQICEDEPVVPSSTVVYSEIKKEPKRQEDENTDTDESEQKSVKMAPPPVPPKPRSASAMDQPIEEMPERRGVLPAQVRPVVAHRPPSPRAAGRATPSIEPDLVGKDRYDKASKCFSYAPAKALNEAFERPRRPSMSRTIERKEEEMNHVDPREAANVEFSTQDLHRFEEPTTWGDQVENTKQEALLKELSRMPARSHSVAAQPYYARNDEDVEEKPVVMEQAQRAVATTTPTGTLQRNKTKYGSYRTLNDERYNSVMDDLCNPEFYLNYQTPTKKDQNSAAAPQVPPRRENGSAPVPPPRQSHMGAKSVEMPRRRFQPIEAFTDPLDEILNSTGPAPAASCVDLRERDSFRNRNCRSVAAAPSRDRRLFSENYDAIESAKEPDDWLMNKLRKVKSKRDLDPDLVRRRTQEKMLLEELKHAHGDNETSRNKAESEYTTEGVGNRAFDALADYRREEERLRNTHSPYQDGQRRSRPIRSKPPTPPPRERSRSPTNKSERATPNIDSQYNTYGYQNGHAGGAKEQENYDFSTLNSIVQPTMNGRESRSLQRKPSFGPPFQYSENTLNNRPDTPTRFFSGQERVAAAINRAETPQRELYASGTIYRAETPNRYYPENNTLAQRSATPSFPVARETPIPFHPLLYGNGKQDMERAQTLNYRSSSPRSQYGQLSRRSSMNSVGGWRV